MFFPFIQHQTIVSCALRSTENIFILQEKSILNFIGVYIALFCIIGIFILMPSPTAGERDIEKHRLVSLILITDQMHSKIDNSNEKKNHHESNNGFSDGKKEQSSNFMNFIGVPL